MKNILKTFFKKQFQLIVLLIVNVGVLNTCYGGEISQVDYKDKSSIVAGSTTLTIYDNTIADELLNPIFYASKRKHQVRLTYHREARTDVPSFWSYAINYQIYSTGTPLIFETGTLLVQHTPGSTSDIYEAINEHDGFGAITVGYPDVTIKVTSVTPVGPGTPPDDIRLELITVTERYTDLALASPIAPLIFYNSITSELTWGYVPGAEEYDVEFTFIDFKDAPPTPIINNEDAFNYKEPIRVTTSNQYYLIDQVYPKGTLYFRVRAVGRHIAGAGSDYSHVSYGDWGYRGSSAPGPPLTFVIPASFQNNKNWGYTAVYAEEGKSKKGIGYSDGGGKSRQSQATMHSDNTVIVGENKYDIEGRAVISILPVPVEVTDPLTAFNYREKFNSTPISQEWDYNDFQLGTNPLGNASGAGKYYSSQNAFISSDPYAKYTDDAGGATTPANFDGGFPFTQISYMRDNTGRVSKTTGGTGTTYVMGTGKNLSYFYCDANSTELHRMFGTNVGVASHYKKNMAIDANGQISISYLDQEERVVATSLAGATPDNLLALPSNITTPIVVSLNGNNIVNPAQNESHSFTDIPNVVPNTLHTFTYDMAGVIYGANINIDGMDNCKTDDIKPICASCKYKLKISITDPDGLVVPIPDPGPVNELTRTFANPIAANCAFNQYNALGVTFAIPFPKIGNYSVSKTLEIDTTGIYLEIQAAILAAGYNQSYIDDLTDCFISQTDFEQCDITCEQHCRTLVMELNPTWDPKNPLWDGVDHTVDIDAAAAPCIAIDCPQLLSAGLFEAAGATCDQMMYQMLQEVSPGGFEFNMNNPTLGTDNAFWTRVQTMMSATPSYSGTPPTTTDLSNPNYIILLDNVGTWINPQPAVVTPGGLKESAFWTSLTANPTQWAEQLVKVHRDYCHYQDCVFMQPSIVYDADMAALDTGWYSARGLGYLDPMGFGRPGSLYSFPAGVGIAPYPTSDVQVEYVASGVDPAFATQTTPTDPIACTNKYQILANELTTDFPYGSYSDVWHYVSDPSNPALYSSGFACNSINKWKVFRGLYLAKKVYVDSLVANDKRCASCKYYADSEVAPPPITSVVATQAEIDTSYNMLADCAERSTLNAIFWMDMLKHYVDSSDCDGNPATTWSTLLSPLQKNEIEHNLMQYCQKYCGVINPMGFILNTDVYPSPTDQYLINVENILITISCSNALKYLSANYNSSILPALAPSPYTISCAPAGGPVVNGTLPNVCFTQMVNYINASVLPSSSTCFTFPSGSTTDSLYGSGSSPCLGGLFLDATSSTFKIRVNSGCTIPSNYSIIRFYRTDGTPVEVNDMISISLPAFHNSSPVTGTPIGVFKNLSCIVNSDRLIGTPLLPEGPMMVYAYEERIGTGTNVSFVKAEAASTCTAQLSNSAMYTITVDYDDLQADCIYNLLSLDTLAAITQYNALVSSFTTQYLNAHFNNCFSNNLTEKFYYEYLSNEYHYTLYYYDQAGNLTQTVPPKGVHFVVPSGFDAFGVYLGTPEPQHTFKTRYTYNSLNQVLTQQTPDAPRTNYFYDDKGRLRFSQNAKQVVSKKYSYTIFDGLSRIIEVGESTQDYVGATPFYTGVNDLTFPNSNRAQVTITAYDLSPASSPSAMFANGNGQQFLRTRVSATSFFQRAYAGTTAGMSYATYYSYDEHGNVNELVQDNSLLASLGNAIRFKYMRYKYQLVSGNVKEMAYQPGKVDQFYHQYIYDADNRLTIAMTSNNGVTWEKDAKYFYYKHGPLARTETSEDKVQGTDFAYTINGWLKGINSTTMATSTDMGKDGNLLTGGTTMDPANNNNHVGIDALGYSLGYFDDDYMAIGGSAAQTWQATTVGTPLSAGAYRNLFNGNIAHTTSVFRDNFELAVPTMGKAYKYDQLNRLKTVNAFTNMSGAVDNINASNSFSGATDNLTFAEAFSYDENGNITDAERWGNLPGVKMDQLKYNYEDVASSYIRNTNKLRYVGDVVPDANYVNLDIDDQGASFGNENYFYDAIGNLIADKKEEIAAIEWNVYGKIDSITRTTGSTRSDIRYRYDATGNRICKIVIPRPSGTPQTEEFWTYTYYVRDAQGNVISIYNREVDFVGGLNPILSDKIFAKEHHMYGSSHLGIENKNINTGGSEFSVSVLSYAPDNSIIRPGSGSSIPSDPIAAITRFVGDKNYEISNHLGNVLVAVTDKKIGVDVPASGTPTIAEFYMADVLASQDYYAFGALMPGRKFNTPAYRYGLNGQEKDDEISNIEGANTSAEYWMYDTRLGRRWNMDPIVKPWESSYACFNNNPIYFADPNGLDGDPPPNEYDDDGDGISEANEGCDAVEICASKGNASKDWYSFIGQMVKSGAVKEYKAQLYDYKLRAYTDGLGRLAYGTTSSGTVDVPQSITARLSKEVEAEALPNLKAAWASDRSGVNPNSLNYMLNPFARAQYLTTRALTVTTQEEGWDLISEVGLEVALYYVPVVLMEVKVAATMSKTEIVVGKNSATLIGGEIPIPKPPNLGSFDDLIANPLGIWKKTAGEVEEILGPGWTKSPLNEGSGWKFTQDGKDGFVSFSTGSARHGNVPYYKINSGAGKVKVVGSGYKKSVGETSKIINAN